MQELDPNFDEGDLRIQIINPDSKTLYEELGISEERKDFLAYRVEKAFLKKDTVTAVLEDVTEECVHENELCFVGYHTGTVHTYMRNTGGMKEQLEKSVKAYEEKQKDGAQSVVATTLQEEELVFEEEVEEEEEELTFEDED